MTDETIKRDEMHSVRRTTVRGDDPQAIAEMMQQAAADYGRRFDEELQEMIAGLDEELQAAGWPPSASPVWVREDGSYAPFPIDPKPDAQVDGKGYPLGVLFTLKQVEPLSDDFFRARIVEDALKLLKERDTDRRLIRAFALGRLSEQWASRLAFGGRVRHAAKFGPKDTYSASVERERRAMERKAHVVGWAKRFLEADQERRYRKHNDTINVNALARAMKNQILALPLGERAARAAISEAIKDGNLA